jgi:exopolysaccharide biosynthesis protein
MRSAKELTEMMKNLNRRGRQYQYSIPTQLVVALVILCVLCGHSLAQEFRSVKDGIEYAEVTRQISGKAVKINLLRLDLKKVRLDVHHAMDAAIGTEKTSSIAIRHGAFAAINAGFFRLDTSIWAGDSAGTLIIDGRLLSESEKRRVAIGIINRPSITEVYLGHPMFTGSVRGKQFTGLPLDGINRQRGEDEIIGYTAEFGKTTLTDPNGVEMTIRNGKVTALRRGGSSAIPQDGFVLSVQGEGAESKIDAWRVGSRLRLVQSHLIVDYDYQPQIEEEKRLIERLLTFQSTMIFKLEDVTNGVPQLIKNGKIEITWEQEKASKAFVETRHPRTAVAKLKDGKFLMITVDGRSEASAGIDLYDLAAYLLELGATDAMNLDGGGSTTMFLDGKVVNQPSDKEGERKISDAILVTLRKKK